MSERIQRVPGNRLDLLYNGDLCALASDDATLWYAVLAWLVDAECQRLAAAGPLEAVGEEGG